MNKELKNFSEIQKRNTIIARRNDLKKLIEHSLFGSVKDAGA